MVEIYTCISCEKKINSETDAFIEHEPDTLECWDCYCHPIGR